VEPLRGLALGLSLCVVVGLAPAARSAGICGDGTVDGGEQCDDGNTADGDCCSATCQYEADGSACPDDGSVCTDDRCDATGVCGHPAGNGGTECRPVGGPCDAAEQCSGTSPDCPADVLRSPTEPCRPVAGACDLPETCTGGSSECPADAHQAPGTPCPDDGVSCTTDACDAAGSCTHQPDDTRCADGVACTSERCDSAAGCVFAAASGGTPCSDGDECTADDLCDGTGQCVPGLTRCADVSVAGRRVLIGCVAPGAGRGRCEAVALVAPPSASAGAVVTERVRRRLDAEGHARLRLRLNRTGRRLLRADGSLPLSVEVTVQRAGEGAFLRRSVVLERGPQ
jgi:cysteine-rich repeat protein